MNTKNLPLIALPILCLLFSCTPKVDSGTEKTNVIEAINRLYQSFEDKDIDLMSEVMAHDESMLSFGTSISDLHNSWSEWRNNHIAQFEAFDKAKITSKKMNVYLSHNSHVAWFADVSDWILIIDNENIQMNDIRITGVLEKRNNSWKIVQIHASVPQN
ncbi:nuclear transport factor 2 family protein [Aestuariivivens sediminicola]|uniref:nuclear transport factor 2 family protein n=1 Tax=Aestuariivivens sediminicola TaxID=2913560 RepID=UPI001F59138C|nr:nuclear transport factor 2 family protein [Aestuariivivens sediminicola]